MTGACLNLSALLIPLLLMAAVSSALTSEQAHLLRKESALGTHASSQPSTDIFQARPIVDQVQHYCKNVGVFGNQNDFPVATELYRSFMENQQHSVFFAVGVNNGNSIKSLFANPWWDKTKVKIFGWEAMLETYNKAAKNLQGHSEVELIHAGISDKVAKLHLSGSGGTAGIYAPGPHGFKDAHEEVNTSRWDDFVQSRQIPEVSYALIDVEGHEMPVVHGMNLEKLKTTFPVFQYELGGTWVDGRHAGPMTQEDAAKYLEGLGYSIFLMGQDAGDPVLARMSPEAFTAAECVKENGKAFIQGNVLAVLRDVLPKKPWLKHVVSEMLEHDRGLA